MILYLSVAIEFVRARMDELSYNNDDMILPADDDRNFDSTVEKLLPEAAEFVVRSAPASLLEPEYAILVDTIGENVEGIESSELKEDGSIVVTIATASGFLRFVAFLCGDSDIYVTSPVPFNSPEARMQANPYTRGTHDAPVVVERLEPGKMIYSYYSVKDKEHAPGFTLYKIDKPSIEDDDGGKRIFCPEYLETAVLNRLTGMVLEAYKDNQHAQVFYQKSANYTA